MAGLSSRTIDRDFRYPATGANNSGVKSRFVLTGLLVFDSKIRSDGLKYGPLNSVPESASISTFRWGTTCRSS